MRRIENHVELTPLGRTARLERRASFIAGDAAGNPLRRVHTFAYDALGRLSKLTRPDGTSTQRRYDARGNLLALSDTQGNVIHGQFDSENRLIAVIATDTHGEVLGGQFNLWDENNELRARLTPDGLAEAHGALPDSSGQIHIDGRGNLAADSRIEDGINLLAADRSTRRIVAGAEGVVSIDGANRTHALLLDDFGRIVREYSPDEGNTTWHYTNFATEKRQRARDGRETTLERLEFTPSGRLVRRTLAGCAESLHYDGGLLDRLEGCGNRQQFVRDAFGQITEHTRFITPESGADNAQPLRFTTRYAYDADSGRLIERRLPDGQRLAYAYHTDGNTRRIVRDAGWLAWVDRTLGQGMAGVVRSVLPDAWIEDAVLSDTTWRPFGGASRLVAGNGVASESRFSPSGRLMALEIGAPGKAPIVSLGYRHDGQGNVVGVEYNGRERRYRYDAMNRLAGEGETGTTAPPTREATETAAMPAPASLRPARFVPDDSAEYDAFGRRVRNGNQRFVYDAAHRLIEVRENDIIVARYRYDAQGQRIAKTVNGRTTYFLYDTARRLTAEADEHGMIVTQYLYADHRPYAVLKGAGGAQTRDLYAVHTDDRGLPLAVTDARQQVVWQGEFDAFGRERTSPEGRDSAAFEMNLRLAGQYADRETGLYYNVYRYYDPRQGRYLTPDPIGRAGGEDAYAYVGGNPFRGIDPQGLFAIPMGALNGNDFYFEDMKVDKTGDEGHADILNVAFWLYQKAYPNRFSQGIINQIIINNYQTDAEDSTTNCVFGFSGVAGGGQCLYTNHFDNPNSFAGAPYELEVTATDPLTEKPIYSPTTTFRSTYTNTNWIQDAIDDVNGMRSRYGDFENNGGSVDISQTLSAFGRNSHTLADFYAHSNWVDNVERGGCVIMPGVLPLGYVPTGLDRRVLWNESATVSGGTLYSGTAGNAADTKTNIIDESTHAYWHKDGDSLRTDEKPYSADDLKAFNEAEMFFWTVEEYDPKTHTTANYKKTDPTGKQLVDRWESASGLGPTTGLKKGDIIYVANAIDKRHRMAIHLAIEHTKNEIDKLWNAAAGKMLGNTGKTLQEAFGMDKNALQSAGIDYQSLWPKDQRP